MLIRFKILSFRSSTHFAKWKISITTFAFLSGDIDILCYGIAVDGIYDTFYEIFKPFITKLFIKSLLRKVNIKSSQLRFNTWNLIYGYIYFLKIFENKGLYSFTMNVVNLENIMIVSFQFPHM